MQQNYYVLNDLGLFSIAILCCSIGELYSIYLVSVPETSASSVFRTFCKESSSSQFKFPISC